MGRNSKKYYKTLHQQAYEKLKGMQAFGESKKQAIRDGTDKDKIFSYCTYETYKKHIRYFIKWIKTEHPECTTLRASKKYVNEWLQLRCEQTNSRGEPLSAWTIQTEAAALNKLYGIDKADNERFQPPRRSRSSIMRSRTGTARDRHFSKTNNEELIAFCMGTGCRRNVLQRLEGRDLWSREQMETEAEQLTAQKSLTEKERKHLSTLRDALDTFPEEDYFVHHRKDKGGRYRFAPIIGQDRQRIIERFQSRKQDEKVWLHIHSGADIHNYRAVYATEMYRQTARPLEDIPYDRYNAGIGKWYQGDVYVCRGDEHGRKLDRRAMKVCSKALGHNRISVIAESYLRGL